MNNKKLIMSGFTLSETLTNLIIVSLLSFSMMFIFFQIQQDFDIEENRTYAINYANRVLDKLSEELEQAEIVKNNFWLNIYTLRLYYPDSEKENIFRISKDGFFKINDGIDVPLDDFSSIDQNNKIKYEISNFIFDDRVGYQVGTNILSNAANAARKASYILTLEIDLFDRKNNKIETLNFNRTIFSAPKFIKDKKSNV